MNFFYRLVNLVHFNRNNWKLILLCFIVAITFWMFNALDKGYTTNLSFPIQFKFNRTKYVPIDPLPKKVVINIKGQGWAILRRSLNFYSVPLSITLEKPMARKKIAGTSLPMLLGNQLKNFEINYVVTDTLHLKIDTWETRKVRVAINPQNFTYATGFGRWKPIAIIPDSVEVTGPKQVVEALHDSIAVNLKEHNLDGDFEKSAKVGAPGRKQLKYMPPTVEVVVNVVRWGQIAHTIGVEATNMNENIDADMVSDSVGCILEIPEEEINNFARLKNQPRAILDLQQLKENSDKIKPQVIDLPAYARLLQVDSVAIKFP